MLRFTLDRETVTKAVLYHVENSEGLTPLVATDDDLLSWLRWVLGSLSGYVGDDLARVTLAIDGDAIQVGVPDDLTDGLDVVRMQVL